MKYQEYRCDFCGGEMFNYWYDDSTNPLKINIKVKAKLYSRQEKKELYKLDICGRCANKIYKICKQGGPDNG